MHAFRLRFLPPLLGAGLAVGALVAPRSASSADIPRTVYTVAGLTSVFSSADADPLNNYVVTVNPGKYLLTSTLKLARGSVYLKGDKVNPSRIIIDGQNQRGVLQIWGETGYRPSLRLEGITVTHGKATDGIGLVGGGGIRAIYGNVSVYNCIIRKNAANLWGSGLFAQEASVYMERTLVDSNVNTQFTTCGGGMTSSGGGIGVANTYTDIYQSTIKDNGACRGGGIVYGGTGDFFMENTTLSRNEAKSRGGGLFLQGGSGSVVLRFNTIAFNKAGSGSSSELRYGGGMGMWSYGGPTEFYGNVIAKNQIVFPDSRLPTYRGQDVYWDGGSTFYTPKYSGNAIGIVDNCEWFFGSSFSSVIGWYGDPFDPKLDPLANNGAAAGTPVLPTHMPQSGSGLVAGFYSSFNGSDLCAFYDERKYQRPRAWNEGICDIGAVERGGIR